MRALMRHINMTVTELFTQFNLQTYGGTGTFLQVCNNGLKFYYIAYATRIMHEFDLSIAYDITTLVHKNSYEFPTRRVNGAYIYDDGSAFVLWENGLRSYFTYNLSVAWDISTATPSTTNNFQVNDLSTVGFDFKESVNKLYKPFVNGAVIYEYNVDIRNLSERVLVASFPLKSISGIGYARDIVVSDDGLLMYVCDEITDKIWIYNLATPFSVTGLTLNGYIDTSIYETFIGSVDIKNNFVYFVGYLVANQNRVIRLNL